MTEKAPTSPAATHTGSWSTQDFAIRVARLAEELQGADTLVLDVEAALQVTDFFVITEGLNRRHLGAIAEHVARELKKDGVYRIGGSSLADENWVLLDFGSVVFHAFSHEARGFYDLENLWGDCDRVRWQEPSEAAGEA